MTRRLAVSNIAWDPSNDDAVARLLTAEGVSAIEIAPTLWRADPYSAPHEAVRDLRKQWADRGLAIVSLQALLFGRPDLQLFGDDRSREELAGCLRRAIDFAHELGASALVFGSPKNRRRGALSIPDAMAIAREFFSAVGEFAHERGAALCLEANPPAYDCDFLTTTADAVDLCRAIGSPGILVNGDVGGMILSGEDIVSSTANAAPLLGHFHASEPQLAELASADAHIDAGASLAAARYPGYVSIEMRRAANGDDLGAIRRAIHLARRAYTSR